MKQVPLLQCFMTRRCTADYVAIFEELKRRLHNPQVAEFISDFEMAVWKAVEISFPNKKAHRGCAFHWAQAVMKRVRDYGLFPSYMKNPIVKNIIEELMCLCYLKHTEIAGVFEQLRSALQRINGLSRRISKRLRKLFNYVDRNWISKGYWKPKKWSVFFKSIR